MPWNKDGSRKSAYSKKSGFKMGGMHFGNDYQKDMGSTMMDKPFVPRHTILDEVKLTANRNSDENNSTDKNSKWSKTKTGHDVKTRKYKNLFGREREVKKYYDKETGKKLGKQVTVDRGKNDPRAKKRKIKKVNPGLTQSGGVGKIRLKENPWEGTKKSDEIKGKAARPEYASTKKELKEFVKTDDEGRKTLSTYDQAWDDRRFTKKDGKKIDKFGNVYDDSEAGKQDFVKAARDWWSKQASDTGNENLLIDSQTGKKQSATKYKRFGRKKKKK